MSISFNLTHGSIIGNINDNQSGSFSPCKGWKPTKPYNYMTGKPYKRYTLTSLLLAQHEMGTSDNRWMTLVQAKKKGFKIKEGSVGVFCRTFGKSGTSFILYHSSQIEGIPDWEDKVPKKLSQWQIDQISENMLINSGAKIIHGFYKAHYDPKADKIYLPNKIHFIDGLDYYGVALHLLIIWTGANTRLNRPVTWVSGDPSYNFEELVAEIASWLLAQELGVPFRLEDHGCHLDRWKRIPGSGQVIEKACSEAQKIYDYLKPFADLPNFYEDMKIFHQEQQHLGGKKVA